jgi:nicotinate dehydrogenase subunit B
MTEPVAETLQFVVNGVPREVPALPDRGLLGVLRDELGLTGAKPGCGEGMCGACTVLVDGRPERSCRAQVAEAAGHSVLTIEGLAAGGRLHPVQQAFLETEAMQCGYCTAGMIMATVALLAENPDPDEACIREALAFNACRCCTYPRIRQAVGRAAELARGKATTLDEEASIESMALTDHPSAPLPETPRPRRPWDLTDPAERDWFAVLPEGLVVVKAAEPARAAWSTSGGTWLHVGTDGLVTAFTGKVDVGQDNRTALSMRVAEELRVPLAQVRLVMGDTDICPYDAGTFGSRSMPDAGEELRRAAASSRAILVGLAADTWGIARSGLSAADGYVRANDGTRQASYGDLVGGRRLVRTGSPDVSVTPGPREELVGTPAPRVGVQDIVTGARTYTTDLVRSGMLHGRILREPAHGATLRSVDISGATSMSGVIVVHEGPFVGVAAPDPATAGRARKAIIAAWDREPQPAESDLVDYLRAHPVEEEGWEGSFHEETGDVDAALTVAPVHLSATYTTAYIAHAPLETHVALAEWDPEGRLTVWTGTQVPFGIRRRLASELEVPEAKVRVIVPATGGGFGGKHSGDVAVEAARLARAAGRPVKVRWNRAEEFAAGYLRPAAVIDIRSGAGDGRLSAWEMRNTNSGVFGLVGPYEIPNQRLDYQPADSPFAQGSYRSLAAAANHFARESHMDELAVPLGVDPLELRLSHLRDDRLADALRTAADRIGWADRARGSGLGTGIAGGIEKGARIATAAEVRVGPERRVEILRIVTVFECGAIVNPSGLRNQVEGATIMGLGGALFEAIHFADGAITNGSLTDYRVPRLADVPPIEVVLLDRRDIPSAGGGETPILAVAPAIANAIFAATGVRLRSLPLVPEGIVPG